MTDDNKAYVTIGIDVGGTNTDVAILLDSADTKLNVIASAKHATTKDVTSGIVAATKQSLKMVYDAYKDKKEIHINCVSIGTTHFVNAIEQRSKELSQVCVIRLCGPVSNAFPPFIDIPTDLQQLIEGASYFIDGGCDYDGKHIAELESKQNESKINEIVAEIKSKQLKSIAITAIFSPMDRGKQEIKLEQILRSKLGDEFCADTHFTLSHQIAGLGLLPRENAAILNATICKLARKTIESFKTAMEELGITSPLYLTKNDGTQCTSEEAIQYPLTTFASGPTNSMKGAALLYDSKDISNSTILVCDIGGTTTDIGMLVNGFIQLSATKCKMAGIETNFAVPNVISRPLGGGTIVEYDNNQQQIRVGPTSVGYNLVKSKCFPKGDTLTLTDVAVFNGNISTDALSKTYQQPVNTDALQGLEVAIGKALEVMVAKLTELVDAARGEKQDLTLILCGGGATLVPRDLKIKGIKQVIIPKYAQVANAIGAASSRISAHLDVMHKFAGLKDVDQEIEKLKRTVMDKAEAKGAKKGTVTIATLELIPIAYIPGELKRVLIKAVGNVDPDTIRKNAQKWNQPDANEMNRITADEYQFNLNDDDSKQNDMTSSNDDDKETKQEDKAITEQYKRELSEDGKIWTLSSRDIDYLSIGCGVMGTGGGGSTRPFDILCKKYIESGHKVRIVQPDTLGADYNVVCVAFMGAPAMLSEKLMNGSELLGVVQQMEQHLQNMNAEENAKRKLALICGEIGGCNGLTPIIAAAQFAEKYEAKSIDLVDADFMGRAFPELQMILPGIQGKSIAPIACQDEYGTQAILTRDGVENNKDAENKMRIKCVELGMKIAISLCPLRGDEVMSYAIPNSYTNAWKIGQIIAEAKARNVDPLLELQTSEEMLIGKGRIVYYGKIVKLKRENDGGFNRGTVKLQRIEGNNNKYIEAESINIDIQNENYLIRSDEKGVLITVPDLIVLFDDDCRAIATEELRYGLRATVMVFPAHPLLKTKTALSVVGPGAFGYQDVEYLPIENFKL